MEMTSLKCADLVDAMGRIVEGARARPLTGSLEDCAAWEDRRGDLLEMLAQIRPGDALDQGPTMHNVAVTFSPAGSPPPRC